MVSRTILSRLRLPFRHIGLWEYPGCGPAPCRRLTAGAGPPRNIAKPVHLAQQIPGHALCIPPHRLIMYVIIAYPACKNQAESFSFRKFGGGGAGRRKWARRAGISPSGAGAGGALAAALMVSFLAGAGHLFSKKTLQMTRNFILYK